MTAAELRRLADVLYPLLQQRVREEAQDANPLYRAGYEYSEEEGAARNPGADGMRITPKGFQTPSSEVIIDDNGITIEASDVADFASLPEARKVSYYSPVQGANAAEAGAWLFSLVAPYTNYYSIIVYKRVVGADTYYPVYQIVTDDASMTLSGTTDALGKRWVLIADAIINGDLDLNGNADISGSLTVPTIKKGAYAWETTIRKTGLADNVATGIFRITTPNAPGTYIVTVRGMATHSTAGYTSVMRFDASYARAVVSSSVGVTGTLASSSGGVAATGAATRTVVSVTPTVVENTELQVDFYLQVDLGGSGITSADVQMVVELQWQQFTSAPTIAAL